nr:CRE-CRI-2 protein [Haemonchus contortus]
MIPVLIAIAACLATSEGACTCFPFPSLRDAFCYSSFVAHVRVIGSIEDADSQTMRYNVRYIETFRNETESKQLPTEIVTASTSAACGVQLINGSEYLIGGSISEDGELQANLCALNKEWSSVSAADRAALKSFKC